MVHHPKKNRLHTSQALRKGSNSSRGSQSQRDHYQPPEINPNPDFGYNPQPAQKPRRNWQEDKPRLFKQNK